MVPLVFMNLSTGSDQLTSSPSLDGGRTLSRPPRSSLGEHIHVRVMVASLVICGCLTVLTMAGGYPHSMPSHFISPLSKAQTLRHWSAVRHSRPHLWAFAEMLTDRCQ